MYNSYEIDDELNEKFNKIGKLKNKNKISRLEMVKISIENILRPLVIKSPNVKVGLVTFGDALKVKGDCLSNILIVKRKHLDDESKIECLGKENTNLIQSEINKSYEKIIKTLNELEMFTALGPGILLSLSLLDKANPGSRIFLSTDGVSNLGVGKILTDNIEQKYFYEKIGNIARKKGISISLIAFEDSESKIDILKSMVELSGGDIFRVNPKYILDEMNDFLEYQIIASEVEIKMNLNKCLTFRDEEKKDMTNDGSTILKKIGNATKEKEKYIEL